MTVSGFEIHSRKPYADGKTFGNAGTYSRIQGTLSFAFDPALEANAGIVDLDLAPRNADGLVESRADVTVIVPDDPAGSNGSLILDVPNRGRCVSLRYFNRSGDTALADSFAAGDGFACREGFSILSVAWQADVDPLPGALTCELPQAVGHDGPVSGQCQVELRPLENSPTTPFTYLRNVPYEPVDPNEPEARMLFREFEHGPAQEVPRDSWRFGTAAGESAATNRVVELDGSFRAGWVYTVIYTASNPTVSGAGLLGLRDAAAFVRTPANGLFPQGFERVISFGVSQTGRLLREMLRLGLTLDEEARPAIDGVFTHIAGGIRGEFNHRFALSSQMTNPSFGHLFPFSLRRTRDPHTGVTASLHDSARDRGPLPKVLSLNSSWEYWRGDAALVHIHPSGESDLEEGENERVYAICGTHHSGGGLPLTTFLESLGLHSRYGQNVVDSTPLVRAALVNLDRWLRDEVEPPASRHPRIGDKSAVSRASVLDRFRGVTEIEPPEPERLPTVRRLNLGSSADRGIAQNPPKALEPYAALVSDVDGDLNEVAGIRLPDISIPVGSHAGWNAQDPRRGDPRAAPLIVGLTRFFASTEADRAPSDPRPSLESRYKDRGDYEAKVRKAAETLVQERLLLSDDVDVVVENCAARYDEALRVGPGNPD